MHRLVYFRPGHNVGMALRHLRRRCAPGAVPLWSHHQCQHRGMNNQRLGISGHAARCAWRLYSIDTKLPEAKGGGVVGNDFRGVKHSDSFIRRTKPIVSGSSLAGVVLLSSVAATLGALYLVTQDGAEQVKNRSYLSLPAVELSRRFSTSGSAGAAVTVEAFSVGEQVSPEALLLRYAFDESDLEDALQLKASHGGDLKAALPHGVMDEGHHRNNAQANDGRDPNESYQHHQEHHRQQYDVEETNSNDVNDPSCESSSSTSEGGVSVDKEGKERFKRKHRCRRRQMQVIGKGAYGRVVRAVDRQTRQKVAMKVVPHSAMSAESLLEEVEVLKRVRGHDNTIHLIDTLYCAGKYYVITELCEGGEVLDHLISNGPFTERAASMLTNRVSSALQHIHKCGFVHLDVKPENLVFASRKSVKDVRIIDFGMAKKISESAGKLMMVHGDKGARVGTMAYWSPEQVASVIGRDGRFLGELERSEVKSDPRACDMWALGVVLYIMLLGCHPFDPHGHGDEREMTEAILKGTFRFNLHGDQLRLSPDAKDLISGLLDPNPKTRYTSTDVLEHPFIAKVRANKKLDHAEILPSSWTKQGFKVDRDDPAYKVLEEGCTKDVRLKPFSTERSGEAFARVLLMAGAMNGRNMHNNPQEDHEITSDRLFLDAFQMFEVNKKGHLTQQSVESLLRLTGDEAEDEVVVSYHQHHDCKDKASNPNSGTTIRTTTTKKKSSPLSDNDKSGNSASLVNEGITFNEFKAFLRKLDCITRSFKKDEVVFDQGSVPQGVYIILNGEARLEYKDHDQDKRQFSYANLTPGSIFGETACLKGSKARSSTIRCTKPSEVLFIPKDIFLRALAGSPALNEVIFTVAMKQQAIRLHELVSYLRPNGLVVRHLPPGAMLFRQGQTADYMYLIREGIVGSNTSAPSSRAKGAEEMSVKLAERGPGDLIGTSAATGGGGTRYSSAKCITPVTVVGIPMDELTRLRREEPIFRFYLENLIHTRKEFWQLQISDLERGVSEPQLLPLLLNDDDDNGTRTGVAANGNLSGDDVGYTVTLSGEAAAAELAKALLKNTKQSSGKVTTLTRTGNIIHQEQKRTTTPESGRVLQPDDDRGRSQVSSSSSVSDDAAGDSSSWTWSRATFTAVNFFNPYSWYTWSKSSKQKEKRDVVSEQQNNIPEGLDLINNKHLKAFEEYARAVGKMSHLRFKGGEYVFQKGDKPKSFFIVDSGTVSVEYVSERGKVLSVAQLGPGDHFGEQVLIEHLPEYVISVRCMSNAEILAMPAEEFHKLVGDGQSTFALAIKHAMKLRQHRWVRNLLKLAKEDKRVRRQEAYARKNSDRVHHHHHHHRSHHLSGGSSNSNSNSNSSNSKSAQQPLVEREERDDADEETFIDRDSNLARVQRMISRSPSSSKSVPAQAPAPTMASGVNRVVMQPGDVLFTKGEPVEAIYMVHRGEVRLSFCEQQNSHLSSGIDNVATTTNDSSSGKQQNEDYTLLPGDTFGLERIRAGAKHNCDAVCVASNTVVSKIPRETMDQLIDGHDFVSQQLRRHARRTVPVNELERRARVDLQKHGSYSSTLTKAAVNRIIVQEGLANHNTSSTTSNGDE